MIGNILAEDNSDSDNDDTRGSNKIAYTPAAFGIGASASYGGAFSVPDRVGSAPATDFKFSNFGTESPNSKK